MKKPIKKEKETAREFVPLEFSVLKAFLKKVIATDAELLRRLSA